MTENFVIVEGVDGSGKTTLAEQLAQHFDALYHHVGPPRSDMTPFAEHIGYAFLVPDEAGRAVFDRFHMGCFAYGPVFRPEKDVDGIGDFMREDWNLFEHLIRPRAFLVLCDPGWDRIEDEWSRRQGKWRQYMEYESDLQVLRTVYDRFHMGYQFSTLPRMTYDYTKEGAWKELQRQIAEALGW